MARHREFNTDDVVQKAMRVFWRLGYVATSMSDLYAATGLKPGSLYAAFKDKEGLFRTAFERYAEYFRATLPKDAAGMAAITAWLTLQAEIATTDDERAGCLIVNTVAERHAHSLGVQALAQGRVQEIRDFFMANLTIATQRGEIADDVEIAAAADALLGAVFAIMMLGRAGADGTTIANVAQSALRSLRPRADA